MAKERAPDVSDDLLRSAQQTFAASHPIGIAVAAVAALVLAWFAPTSRTIVWLILVVDVYLGSLLMLRIGAGRSERAEVNALRGSATRSARGAQSTPTRAGARPCLLCAMLIGAAWGAMPLIVPADAATGRLIQGMFLAVVLVGFGALLGSHRGIQMAHLLPMFVLSSLAVLLDGGRAGFANAFVLLLSTVGGIVLGNLQRRSLVTALRGSAEVQAMAADLAEANERLEMQAHHDELTGLANRPNYRAALDRAVQAQNERGVPFAVGFLDLDHLKRVNDSFGHSAGDELLLAVANRLADAIAPGDTVARFGGDEFAFVLRNVSTEAEAVIRGRRILRSLDEPVSIAGQPWRATASLGMALSTGDAELSSSSILHRADQALYEVKRSGRNNVSVHTAEIDLRTEPPGGSFVPVIDVRTNEIVAARFDPRAASGASTGLATAVTSMLNARAHEPSVAGLPIIAKVAAEHADSLLEELEFSIGVRALRGLSLVLAGASDLDDASLTAALDRAKVLGVTMLVQHVGTSTSPIELLKNHDFDGMTIAEAFTAELTTNEHARTLVGALSKIGAQMGMTVIAEGVSTPEQSAQLQVNRVHRLHGPQIHEPLTFDGLAALLSSHGEGGLRRSTWGLERLNR